MKEEFDSRNEMDRDDAVWDPFFRQQPMGSEGFVRRVVAAASADRRRRRYTRSGWSAAAAAAIIAAVLWVIALPTGPNGGAYANEIDPEEIAAYAAFVEWESMLTDAGALVETGNQELLEMLFVAGDELPD